VKILPPILTLFQKQIEQLVEPDPEKLPPVKFVACLDSSKSGVTLLEPLVGGYFPVT